MKKLFAVILAAAMVLGLSSVTFADVGLLFDREYYYGGEIYIYPFFKYDDDDTKKLSIAQAEYGETYYAPLVEKSMMCMDNDPDDGSTPENLSPYDLVILGLKALSDKEMVENLKIKTEFESGGELVESVSIVKKFINGNELSNNRSIYIYDGYGYQYYGSFNDPITLNGYYYFVELKTKKQTTTDDADIIGTITFNRKGDDKKVIPKVDDWEQSFALNLFYENTYINANGQKTQYTVEDSVKLKWDDVYTLKFDSNDEVEIEFGTEPNEGTFTVKAAGQGKIIFDYNTTANDAICDANPGVKMFFVNFNGANFNRVGEFEYEMEDMAAAYEVVGDKLVAIPGLEIESDTATFRTRTLGNYGFATAELVDPSPAA